MSGWPEVSIGEIAEVKGGKRLPSGTGLIEEKTKHPYLRIVDFYQGGIRDTDLMYVPDDVAPAIKRYIVQTGDVFISIVGTIGLVGLIPGSLDGANLTENAAKICVNNELYNSAFLKYFLMSPEGQERIDQMSVGSTQRKLALFRIKDIVVPLPPVCEQREIAAILGALDDKIEVNRKASATLEEMARALYRSWFVDFDPVWARLEGRQPVHMDAATAALFPDSFGDDGLPVGWKTAPYLDLVEIISGGTPKTSIDDYWNGDIPWYSVVDAPTAGQVFVHSTEKNISSLGFENSAVKLIPRGATIISARGTVGKIAMAGGEMVFNQSCYGLRGKQPETDAFVYFATERGVEQLQSMAHGSVFATITRKTFEGLELAKPPIELLKAYDAAAGVWLDRIHALGLESRTLTTLRDTLLPRLMSGELRIGEARELVEEVA